jgi:uncharacterized protein (UPF0276 family)
MIGLGWRRNLAGFIRAQGASIECLEITPDHFFEQGHEQLEQLATQYPLFVHGLSCSLGTPGPLDEDYLKRFAEVVRIAQPQWVSEHIAFTRAGDIDLGHLNPLAPTRANLTIMVDHARQLSERMERPLLLENITSSLLLEGEMPETEFISELCRLADCGLLLDVTNLFINAHNHGYDAHAWLAELPSGIVRQLHVVGYHEDAEGHLHDEHGATIQPVLLELIAHVIRECSPQAIILERDDPAAPLHEIIADLEALHGLS